MPSTRSRMQPEDRRRQLVDAVIELTATRGLDAVSVREVAAEAGVSIGAVQHHFASKDELVQSAFEAVVDATRARVAGVQLGEDVATNVERVLGELLPLDETRTREARVYLAFAARAAQAPALQQLQAELLRDVRAELARVLGKGRAPQAALLLAVVDGLALQQVSAPEQLTPRRMRQLLRLAVAASLLDCG